MIKYMSGAGKYTRQICADHVIPICNGHIRQKTDFGNSRIVDQNIDSADGLCDVIAHFFDGTIVCYVTDVGENRHMIGITKLTRQCFQRGSIRFAI